MKEHRPLGWTTLEEAKKLVDAGLDPNTADMSYNFVVCNVINGNASEDWLLQPFPLDDRQPYEQLPCWSLGALIDLMPMFEYNRIKIPFGAHVVSTGEIVLQYFTADTGESIMAKKGKEFIDAVISMILWLLENNNIKKHE